MEFRYDIADYFLTMSGSEPNHSIKKSISKQNSPSPVLWKRAVRKIQMIILSAEHNADRHPWPTH
jgi:hypothetical protein